MKTRGTGDTKGTRERVKGTVLCLRPDDVSLRASANTGAAIRSSRPGFPTRRCHPERSRFCGAVEGSFRF